MEGFHKYMLFLGLSLAACTLPNVGDELPVGEPVEDCTLNYTTPAVNKDTVIEIWSPSGPMYQFPERYAYSHPVFNPNNPNEIAYIRKDRENFSPCNYELWTFNFCTGNTSFLTTGICYGLDWSVKDWLIFTGTNRQLYKIKSNGDSLTQLTFSGLYNNNANWNDFGNAFVFSKTTEQDEFYVFANEHGEPFDSLIGIYGGAFSWDGDFLSYIAYEDPLISENQGLWLHHITNNYRTLIQSTLPPHLGGHSKESSQLILEYSEAFWNDRQTLNLSHIRSNYTVTILRGADNRAFAEASVSSNNQTIVFHRIDYVEIDHIILEIYDHLYLVDIDGSNERKVLIPE